MYNYKIFTHFSSECEKILKDLETSSTLNFFQNPEYLKQLIKNSTNEIKLVVIFKEKLITILFLFWLVSVVSSFFSKDILFSLKSSLFYLRIIIFILVINIIFKIKEKDLSKIFNLLSLIFIFLFIDSTFQKLFGYNLIGIALVHPVRVSSFFGDELILGSYLVKLYPILIAFLES